MLTYASVFEAYDQLLLCVCVCGCVCARACECASACVYVCVCVALGDSFCFRGLRSAAAAGLPAERSGVPVLNALTKPAIAFCVRTKPAIASVFEACDQLLCVCVCVCVCVCSAISCCCVTAC